MFGSIFTYKHVHGAVSAGCTCSMCSAQLAVVVNRSSRQICLLLYLCPTSSISPSLQLMSDRRSNRGQAEPIASLVHAAKIHVDTARRSYAQQTHIHSQTANGHLQWLGSSDFAPPALLSIIY